MESYKECNGGKIEIMKINKFESKRVRANTLKVFKFPRGTEGIEERIFLRSMYWERELGAIQ